MNVITYNFVRDSDVLEINATSKEEAIKIAKSISDEFVLIEYNETYR